MEGVGFDMSNVEELLSIVYISVCELQYGQIFPTVAYYCLLHTMMGFNGATIAILLC